MKFYIKKINFESLDPAYYILMFITIFLLMVGGIATFIMFVENGLCGKTVRAIAGLIVFYVLTFVGVEGDKNESD